MNSLKPVAIMAVLGAVAYGVYLGINRSPQTANTPGEAPSWPAAPKVEIPGRGVAGPELPGNTPGSPQVGPGASAPSSVSSGTSGLSQFAPPESPPVPVGTLRSGSAGGYGPADASGNTGAPGVPGAAATAASPWPSPRSHDGPGPAADSQADPLASRRGATAGATNPQIPHGKFSLLMQSVEEKLDEGNLADAHLELSSMYNNPDVPVEQVGRVTDLLDQLAGTVIYSPEHLLEPPYTVRPGETLEEIAESHNVAWQLLGKINGIRDPRRLEPGQQLKVVRGPFRAVIDLTEYELTLMLGSRYAGRFPIGVGRDRVDLEGTYVVRDKTVNPQYYGRDVTIEADDPNNPLGEFWIGLGNQIGIHGTNDPGNLHRTGGRGCICLGNEDIEDLFGILSIGSRVVIRR